MARLVQEDGPGAGTAYPIPGKLTLGRLPDNDVVLAGEGVSRHHARVFQSGDDYILADLNSRNGTMLNGVRAEHEKLRPGDRVEVGGFHFVFEGDPPPRPAPPPPPPPVPRAAAPAAGITTRDRGTRRDGILQFSSYRDKKARAGLFGEEVSQWSFGARLLLYVFLAALSLGLLYGGFRLGVSLFRPGGAEAPAAEPEPDGK